MIILGIDPGTTESGVVVYDSAARRVLDSKSDFDNQGLAVWLDGNAGVWWLPDESNYVSVDTIVCEWPAPMGQPLSHDLVDTIVWCGAFMWATPTGIAFCKITRNQVKVSICGKCQGVKDAHVLCGVQERFGGKDAARGNKAAPGPLYGVSGHAWQALAAVIAAKECEPCQTS